MVKTRRMRRTSGGSSHSYSFGGPVAPGAPYAATVVGSGECNAAYRPGTGLIASDSGLPGMKGGRYEFSGGVTPGGLVVSGGQSIPCERSNPSPLNSGSGLQSGGSAPYETAFLQEQNAGYTQLASGGDDGVIRGAGGSVNMINVPIQGAGISPACVKTGGRRYKKSKKGKKGKKGKKSQKRRHR